MSKPSLASLLQQQRNPVELLRNSKIGMYVYPVVAAEFTNWRDEQKGWRESAVLFDQSHHMDEVIVEGADAARFLEGLAINSFTNFGTDRAKHFVPVSPEGYVIGDMICFREAQDKFILVGRATTANWVQYNGILGNHQVRITRDPRSRSRPDGNRVERLHYRFQVQGPRQVRPRLRRAQGARSDEGQAAQQEGDLRVERRGRGAGGGLGLPARRATLQVDRLPAAELRLVELRQGDEGRPAGRAVDVQRLQLQRALHAVARRRRAGRRGRRPADAGLGRAGRRQRQDLDRAARQAEVRVRVAPTPYAREARERYAESWRTKAGA